jgi:NagD protein
MPLGYFIDVQGTLLSDLDKTPLPGACELIEILNTKKIPYCVITNNTKIPSSLFLKDLRKMGLDIRFYLDPFMVMAQALHVKKIAPFGPSSFKEVLESLDYELDTKNPQALVIASHTDFDASEFARMIGLAQNGAQIIGMHGTSIYAKNGLSYPGVGAILAMLSYATSSPAKIIGKPSTLFYEAALEILKSQNESLVWSDIQIVSDDAKGDLVGAKELGMQTRLVLSGKIKSSESVKALHSYIDIIDSDVSVLAKELA